MKKILLFACLVTVLASGCSKKEDPTPTPGPTPGPTPTEKVSDACGNTYAVVTIGTQTWMAENLKCDKYDTESEAAKAGITSIPTSASAVYTAYYTDATDKSKWNTKEGDYSGNLSSDQIAKLGYLYNWAAATGVADGKSIVKPFTGDRQGICPNGWHLPSTSEWSTLANFIDGEGGQMDAGKKLKSASGWYQNGNGTDDYGFAALPAGSANGNEINSVGFYANLCSATPNSAEQMGYIIFARKSDIVTMTTGGKQYGLSVRCVKGNATVEETLSVTPSSMSVAGVGGTFDITVTSNTYWTVSSNQTWAVTSIESGSGNMTFKVTIDENLTMKPDAVTISITTQGGKKVEVLINRAVLLVTDICGNTYNIVTINGRTWMVENMRCNKYDTESEAYKNGLKTIGTYSAKTPAFYQDASIKSNWSEASRTESGVNLSSKQVSQLGYLYNWEAAVGLYGSLPSQRLFSDFRQGVCPNGWHVPNKSEWQGLHDAIYKEQKLSNEVTSKYVKSASGWYENGNGVDSYGFAVLPAGFTKGLEVGSVGQNAYFWTSQFNDSPYVDDYAFTCVFKYSSNAWDANTNNMTYGRSVRCVKDF